MTISDVKPGSVMVTPLHGEAWIAAPRDVMYSSALMCCSHHWIHGRWVAVEDISHSVPTFLSMRDILTFRNSPCHWRKFGVLLDGEPVRRWETADSERGFVDLWERSLGTVRRHRIFGNVEFVKL